ncbi:hypothetical protein ACNOYE_03845 [Nannocystaceae bacterium ST9]
MKASNLVGLAPQQEALARDGVEQIDLAVDDRHDHAVAGENLDFGSRRGAADLESPPASDHAQLLAPDPKRDGMTIEQLMQPRVCNRTLSGESLQRLREKVGEQGVMR